MTNEEAKQKLTRYRDFVLDDNPIEAAVRLCEAITIAISALESIGRITAERDAAVEELRNVTINCFCCKWLREEDNLHRCYCPEPCCEDGNPDRWEWRGVQDENENYR